MPLRSFFLNPDNVSNTAHNQRCQNEFPRRRVLYLTYLILR